MKAHLFVATLLAGSLMSFGAFAHHSSHGVSITANTNIAVVGISHSSNNFVAVTQINGSVNVNIGGRGRE